MKKCPTRLGIRNDWFSVDSDNAAFSDPTCNMRVFDDIGSRSQGMVPSSSRSASNAQNESGSLKSRSVHVVETMLRQFFHLLDNNTLAVKAFIISYEPRRIAAANVTAFTARKKKFT